MPSKCPKCGGKNIYRYGWLGNKVCDLKFSKSGIKRWIAKYRYPRLICWSCKGTFSPTQRYSPDSKYGPGFMAYVLYNLVDLQISQAAVARTLNQFFGFGFTRHRINYVKSRAAEIYEGTYKQIIARLAHGNLVHVDETKIRLRGRDGFVWVFASLEDVAYVYSDTREAATPKSLLADFRGVLVTDFYSAYDSINCPQQKCLIHLIRDLNDDLRRNPFNEEMQEVGRTFATLVRPMVETIDRYGLKVRHLRKHIKSVEHFYEHLAKSDYQSEIAVKYRKRFDKNRASLFTFLEHDGVPWNNNNAEHAIKAFADLRNIIGGTSSPNGIREYLTLLSLCQTCKYRGINFLEFVRSGKAAIERFASPGSLLPRMTIKGGLQHCIGEEGSRFDQRKDEFIENIDDVCIHYDGGRVAANKSLITEITERGLRKTTKATGLDRKTIRAIIKGKKVKASTLARVVTGLREE